MVKDEWGRCVSRRRERIISAMESKKSISTQSGRSRVNR
jgi:hypothetical protein